MHSWKRCWIRRNTVFQLVGFNHEQLFKCTDATTHYFCDGKEQSGVDLPEKLLPSGNSGFIQLIPFSAPSGLEPLCCINWKYSAFHLQLFLVFAWIAFFNFVSWLCSTFLLIHPLCHSAVWFFCCHRGIWFRSLNCIVYEVEAFLKSTFQRNLPPDSISCFLLPPVCVYVSASSLIKMTFFHSHNAQRSPRSISSFLPVWDENIS